MKIHYNAPRGQRIKYGQYQIMPFDNKQHFIYCPQLHKWFTCDEYLLLPNTDDIDWINCQIAYSVRGAIRAVKKSNVPKGTKFAARARIYRGGKNPKYDYYDVIITK